MVEAARSATLDEALSTIRRCAMTAILGGEGTEDESTDMSSLSTVRVSIDSTFEADNSTRQQSSIFRTVVSEDDCFGEMEADDSWWDDPFKDTAHDDDGATERSQTSKSTSSKETSGSLKGNKKEKDC